MLFKFFSPMIFATIATLLLLGCGGGVANLDTNKTNTTLEDKEIAKESKYTKEDMESRAVLKKAELTTEVDQKRMRVLGDVLDEFEPSEEVIYLVATLKQVPTQAAIEVRWHKDNVEEPFWVSDINGSDTFSFVSSFSPADKDFIPGTYRARIFVNNREVGGASFSITGQDPFALGTQITRIKFSTKISSKMNPKKASKKFKTGTTKLHVTFDVINAIPEANIKINWLRENLLFNDHTMTVAGSGRFGSDVDSPKGLPNGAYTVEIELNGEVVKKSNFKIGSSSGEPSIDHLALGLSLGSDNMPKKEKTTFKKSASTIFCGLRFLDLAPNTVITVQWNLLEEDGESLYHTTKTAVPNGGSGTMGAKWNPNSAIEAGNYQIVVLIEEEELASLKFEVK